MKIPPPHGLVCAAGVFVLGRYCPYSGESCRCPEIRRAICQHRRKCHLPGMLLAPGCGKSVRRTAFLSDRTAPLKPGTYAREALPLPVSPLGSVSAPEEMPSSRHAPCPGGTEQFACLCVPKQKRRLHPGKPGRGRRAVFIRLRRNSPLHCWSGTQLRPGSPARWSPAQRYPPRRGYSPSRLQSSPRADPAHCGQSSRDRGASP